MEIIPCRYRDNSRLPEGDSAEDFYQRLIGTMLQMPSDSCALVLETRDPLANGVVKAIAPVVGKKNPTWVEPDGLLIVALNRKTVIEMMASLAPEPRWAKIANEIMDGLKAQPTPSMKAMVLIDSDQCCVADIDPRATALRMVGAGFFPDKPSN